MLDELLLSLIAGRLVQLLLVLGAVLVARAQLIDERLVIRPLRFELVDPAERLPDELLPRMRLLVARVLVAAEVQCADQERKREALADQRNQDHGERDHHERISRREGRPARKRRGDRERGRERYHPAHPGPGEHGRFRDGQRLPRTLHDSLPCRHAEDPDGPHRDEGDADEDTEARELEERGAIHLVGERRDLETDEQEDHAVQQEDEHLPHRAAREPRVRPHDLRAAPSEVQTCGDGREDAGPAQELGREVRGVRREERHGDLDGHVGQTRPHDRDDPTDEEPNGDADDTHDGEAPEEPESQHRSRRERGGHRDPVDGQRRRVVQKALAFQQADDPSRHRQSFRHCGRGDLVGG